MEQSGSTLHLSRLNQLFSTFDDDDYDQIEDDDSDREDQLGGPTTSNFSNRKIRKVEQLPEKFAMMYKMATDLYLQDMHEEVLKIYRDIAKNVKNFAPLYNIMADCHLSLNRPEEAFQCSKKAVSIDPRYKEAWTRFIELADMLGYEADLLDGLKKSVRLHMDQPEIALGQLRRLLELLEANGEPSVLKYQKLMFELEYEMGDREGCYVLGIRMAHACVAAKKTSDVVQCLESVVLAAVENHENVPEEFLAVYIEVLLESGYPERVIEKLLVFNLIKLRGPPVEQFDITATEEMTTRDGLSLPLQAAACAVMVGFGKYEAAKKLIDYLLRVSWFPHSRLFLSLAVALLEKEFTTLARDLLERLQQQREFQTSQFYFQLGLTFENLGDTKQALDAYNRAVSLEPTLRAARYRIRRLGLPVPSTANIGSAENRLRTIMLQKKIYEEYVEAMDAGGDPEKILRLAVDLVTSTFGHMEEMNPIEMLLSKATMPVKMDSVLREVLLYAPTIATNDIPLEEFWDVVMTGCKTAFQLKRINDLLLVAFHAMCTADFTQFPEKVRVLKMAVAVTAFYLRRPMFSLRYLREELTLAGTASAFSVPLWNFFYMMTCEGPWETAMYKWAFRWAQQHEYSLELSTILANGSMRRGNYRHALELYKKILKKEGVERVAWYTLLHIGVIYANLACQCHVPQRVSLYSTAMFFLEKYGCRRGICPEVFFNKGRAAQQFGDMPKAVGFYQECLRLCDKTSIVAEADLRNCVDFTFQAAYNLRAVYLCLGQYEHVEDLFSSYLSWNKMRLFVKLK